MLLGAVSRPNGATTGPGGSVFPTGYELSTSCGSRSLPSGTTR